MYNSAHRQYISRSSTHETLHQIQLSKQYFKVQLLKVIVPYKEILVMSTQNWTVLSLPCLTCPTHESMKFHFSNPVQYEYKMLSNNHTCCRSSSCCTIPGVISSTNAVPPKMRSSISDTSTFNSIHSFSNNFYWLLFCKNRRGFLCLLSHTTFSNS